jgi:ParB/RepB/Spo0J family partition protein
MKTDFFTRNAGRLAEDTQARTKAGVEPAEYAGRARLNNFVSIELARIVADPQHRETFTQESLEQLAASLKEHGQKQPIRVRWEASRERYVIIAGERRFRAAQLAGWQNMECSIADAAMTADEILVEQLVENLHREDLKPSERAKAYGDLMARKGWTCREAADALHVGAATVSRLLAVNDMPLELRQQLDAGDIALVDAIRTLKAAGAKPAKEQTQRKKRAAKQFRLAVDGGYTVNVKARKLLTPDAVVAALRLAIAKVEGRVAA